MQCKEKRKRKNIIMGGLRAPVKSSKSSHRNLIRRLNDNFCKQIIIKLAA